MLIILIIKPSYHLYSIRAWLIFWCI